MVGFRFVAVGGVDLMPLFWGSSKRTDSIALHGLLSSRVNPLQILGTLQTVVQIEGWARRPESRI